MLTPYFEDEGVVVYHGDARDVLPELEFDAQRLAQPVLPRVEAAAEEALG